ncbi:3-hydroxyisobutyrate dehydrogenase [Jiella sp. MQZ9-1]|uniref:3-hydroxyisobutyrate dehydrogenase n=1 Tax=Jiella flava TaxID=2816857 RepID=A0A939G1U9_9HYPH|nr:3-hydroxyisobutyrate dehydrogenase [Jiella flava]MBO0664315.1 3-hydroxyisobutyrate dehydrogenase [Jiella flava]MCD2472762.1 3-hydroxyisobutyrate dehydrogenase [Jiella flava]
MKIGFIGLGHMGAPMAKNLAAAGHGVKGFDTVKVTVEGVETVATMADAVAGMEAIVTMLPNGDIVRRVHETLIDVAEPGRLVIDCSTIDVESARAVHALAEGNGLLSLDAPVSGGTGGAEAGTLTFMVGGSDAAFAKGRPLFEIMGQKAVHCGEAGAGQAAKICNNMILGISMIGVCEAFHLADRLGLDRQAMFDVASTSSGSCWSLNTYCPAPGIGPESPADRGYKPGFAAELMLKDLQLSQEAAEANGAVTKIGRQASDIYARFVEAGGRGQDFSAILEALSGSKG